jgi:hypothetical protein
MQEEERDDTSEAAALRHGRLEIFAEQREEMREIARSPRQSRSSAGVTSRSRERSADYLWGEGLPVSNLNLRLESRSYDVLSLQ